MCIVFCRKYIENIRWEIGVLTKHEQHANVFKAFCDEKRLAILEMLREGELCACKIQERLPIGQSTLSHHMKILCTSGIVSSRREGKWTHYSINPKGCAYAAQLLSELTNTRAEGAKHAI
ncbi:metalloregulator ArsR/SmtB family transcription factor [Eubacteriales bacterium OttesenSCG-928-M02]|nr:metalloregulator ArsR/SmtB family transcription factor [Eubacteriales bacterium OttesenSCG-928-M02]